jgi:hypothetical protein
MPRKRWDRNPKQPSKRVRGYSMDDHDAMLAIQQELDGGEWTADTLERVAEILQQAGYRIRDLDDHDPGDEAIHAGVRDPKEPARMPGPGHVLD